MIKNKYLLSVCLFIFFFCSTSLLSQTTNYYKFILSDSSQVVGYVTFEDESSVQIKTISGNELRINKSNIVRQEITNPGDLKNKQTNSPKIHESNNSILDSTITIRLELTDGSTLIGNIEFEDSTSVSFNLLSKTKINIDKATILKREIVTSKIQNGEYWIEDPNRTRLFFAPTGRGLRSGKGYFSVYEIFFPMVAFGMFDYVTISGGMSLFPGSEQLIYFAPKITPFQNDKYAISVGDFFVKFPSQDENLNILYGVFTASFDKGAITLGSGFETNDSKPIFLVGGELRISRYAKLITENWFIADSDLNFASFGFRFLGEHLAADFAFVIPLVDDNDIILIPWIGFAYNF